MRIRTRCCRRRTQVTSPPFVLLTDVWSCSSNANSNANGTMTTLFSWRDSGIAEALCFHFCCSIIDVHMLSPSESVNGIGFFPKHALVSMESACNSSLSQKLLARKQHARETKRSWSGLFPQPYSPLHTLTWMEYPLSMPAQKEPYQCHRQCPEDNCSCWLREASCFCISYRAFRVGALLQLGCGSFPRCLLPKHKC